MCWGSTFSVSPGNTRVGRHWSVGSKTMPSSLQARLRRRLKPLAVVLSQPESRVNRRWCAARGALTREHPTHCVHQLVCVLISAARILEAVPDMVVHKAERGARHLGSKR